MVKECKCCGQSFEAKHGNKQLCPDCEDVVLHHRGFARSRQYDNPTDPEAYERALRKRNIERHKDNIIAEGYAERQRAKTLSIVSPIKTTL